MKLIKKQRAKVVVLIKTNERKGNTSKSITFSEGTVEEIYEFILGKLEEKDQEQTQRSD